MARDPEPATGRLHSEDRGTPSGNASSDETDTLQRIEGHVRQRLFTSAPPVYRIGRFVVLDEIGRGGMGMVYAAYDEQLDRKVAIKVLHDEELLGEVERLRLLREAQALARLSHPNVVTVHEAGQSEGRVFLAMEYLRGQSLYEWLTTKPEPHLVLETFVKAGRGLMAAHANGLIHRDFKPHNVVRTDDGVVKVLDFGLARVVSDELDESTDLRRSSDSLFGNSSTLTRTGAVAGTPPYMAPEQHLGQTLDARSDQYGFCVALWQGLTGARPFRSSNFKQLRKAKLAGPPPWPDSAPPIRRQVIEALRKGLSPDPDERWPSMDALLEQLDEPTASSSRRWALVVAGVVALGLSGSWAFGQYVKTKDQCTGAEAKLAEVWNDDHRSSVRAAIEGAELTYAAQTWERVEPRLDAYAEAWAQQHTDACEATTIRGEQSPEVMDLRMSCLDRRRLALRATVDVLVDADGTVVENAVKLTVALPGLSRCEDLEALRAEVPPPDDPAMAQEVEALRETLVSIEAAQEAGRYASALEQVGPALAQAELLEYPPLLAETLLLRSSLRAEQAQYDLAERDASTAYALALEHRDDELAARAAKELTYLVGYIEARHVEGLRLGKVAMALARRIQDDERLAFAMGAMGSVYSAQGDFREQRRLLEDTIRLLETVHGPDHPRVAAYLTNLGGVLVRMGEYEDSRRALESSVRIREETFGPDHPIVVTALINLSAVHMRLEEPQLARQRIERALGLAEASWGGDHPQVAHCLTSLASALRALGETDLALEHLDRALLIYEGLQGSHAMQRAVAQGFLSEILYERGDYEGALRSHERTLGVYEEVLGEDHAEVGIVLVEMARTGLELGDYEAARGFAKRAVGIFEETSENPRRLAQARFELARGLWFVEGEQERARGLAEQVRETLVQQGDGGQQRLGDVERWLEDHPLP